MEPGKGGAEPERAEEGRTVWVQLQGQARCLPCGRSSHLPGVHNPIWCQLLSQLSLAPSLPGLSSALLCPVTRRAFPHFCTGLPLTRTRKSPLLPQGSVETSQTPLSHAASSLEGTPHGLLQPLPIIPLYTRHTHVSFLLARLGP